VIRNIEILGEAVKLLSDNIKEKYSNIPFLLLSLQIRVNKKVERRGLIQQKILDLFSGRQGFLGTLFSGGQGTSPICGSYCFFQGGIFRQIGSQNSVESISRSSGSVSMITFLLMSSPAYTGLELYN